MSDNVSHLTRVEEVDKSDNKIVMIIDYDWLYRVLYIIVGTYGAEKVAKMLLYIAFTRETLKMTLDHYNVRTCNVRDSDVEAIVEKFFD